MIEIGDYEVMGIKMAINGMRNPLNSWMKSDSFESYIGEDDRTLCKKLINAGTEHRKFLRMIHVQVNILAPLYWWKEFDTYKVGTVANSCSTMHTIHKKNFDSTMFSVDHLETEDSKKLFEETIDILNTIRRNYLHYKKKSDWYELIQLLPASFNQLRTIDMNYEVLLNIYYQRKEHKLDEWHKLCSWIELLPYMNDFIGEPQNE